MDGLFLDQANKPMAAWCQCDSEIISNVAEEDTKVQTCPVKQRGSILEKRAWCYSNREPITT